MGGAAKLHTSRENRPGGRAVESPIEIALPREAAEQISVLSGRLDKLTDEIADRAATVEVPTTLFHYTNSAGLSGIIESGRLRLSDVFGLNDPSEMRHGVRYALNALQQAAATGHRAAQLFVWRFSEHLSEGLESVSRQFVTCFSPSGDDLGQWRACAANGKGVALGFDGPRLETAFRQMPPLSGTFSVNYDECMLRETSERIAREALLVAEFPVGKGYDGPTVSAFLSALSVQTSNAILYTAMFFKHPAYEIEREYRFQHVRAIDDLKGVATVESRSFIEFDWRSYDPDLLTHIIVGPAADREQAQHYAEECLRSAGIDLQKVHIQPSAIPYRS